MRLHAQISAVGINGVNRPIWFCVAGMGNSRLDAPAKRLKRRRHGDIRPAKNAGKGVGCIEAPPEQIQISPGLICQISIFAQPRHAVDADHAAVGRGADAEIQAPVVGHGNVGDRIIPLRRQVGHDCRVRTVITEGGDHSAVLIVAVGHINSTVGDHNSADRAVNFEFVAAQAKRQLAAVGIDLEERSIRPKSKYPRSMPVITPLGDQQRPAGVKGDGSGGGQAFDIGTELCFSRIFDDFPVDGALHLGRDDPGPARAAPDQPDAQQRRQKQPQVETGTPASDAPAKVHMFCSVWNGPTRQMPGPGESRR